MGGRQTFGSLSDPACRPLKGDANKICHIFVFEHHATAGSSTRTCRFSKNEGMTPMNYPRYVFFKVIPFRFIPNTHDKSFPNAPARESVHLIRVVSVRNVEMNRLSFFFLETTRMGPISGPEIISHSHLSQQDCGQHPFLAAPEITVDQPPIPTGVKLELALSMYSADMGFPNWRCPLEDTRSLDSRTHGVKHQLNHPRKEDGDTVLPSLKRGCRRCPAGLAQLQQGAWAPCACPKGWTCHPEIMEMPQGALPGACR